MCEFYKELDAKLQEFITEQKIFFVGTADTDGRVNVSPKGMNVQNLVFARLNMWGSGRNSVTVYNDIKCLNGW